MTIVTVMDNLAKLVGKAVEEYSTNQPSGRLPIAVYAGFPPVPTRPDEKASYVYCKTSSFQDEQGGNFGSAKVDIGFSIYDADWQDGPRELYNVMERVRQNLLKNPYIGGGASHLELPLTGEIFDEQPYPQWQGIIHATYTIGQPEQEIDFESMQEVKAYD